MRSISEAFGQPTFVFKNHSWAQAYPNCYTASDPADLTLIEPADYIEDFLSTVRELRPRYAVPFASMVCFLHPESQALNSHAITPPDVASAFAADPVPGTELVCMAPLDRWDSDDGFSLDPTDWYDGRDARVAALAAEMAPLVEQSLQREAERELTFEAFDEHFGHFVKALPRVAGLAVKQPVVFHVADDELPAWVVDVRHRRVYRAAEPPAGTASVVHVAPGLLADALASHIVDFVYISMRLRIELEPGGIHSDLAFWGLLMIWDLGYLPMRRVVGPRSATVAWRRRRELFDWATRLVGRGPLVGRMSGGLMADAER
jgi:hypothetical protein